MKNTIILLVASWTTDTKIDNIGFDHQFDIGSAAKNISSNLLIVAHHKDARPGAANIAKKLALFYIIDVRKDFVETVGFR